MYFLPNDTKNKLPTSALMPSLSRFRFSSAVSYLRHTQMDSLLPLEAREQKSNSKEDRAKAHSAQKLRKVVQR